MANMLLGASTASLAGYSLLEAVQKIQDMGFEAIELLAFDGARHSIGNLAGFWFNRMSDSEKRTLRKALHGFKHVSTHLPFIDVPLFSHNLDIAEFCRGHLKMAIEGSAYFGATTAAIHVYPKVFYKFSEYWDEMLITFRDLGDHAAQYGLRLGIETGIPATIPEYTQLIHDINHPLVGGLVDTGHCFFYREVVPKPSDRGTLEAVKRGNDCLNRIVEILGAKCVYFHLHDVRQKDWRDHRAVGRGVIDWSRLLQALRGIGYAGVLIFELEETDCIEALAESRAALVRLLG